MKISYNKKLLCVLFFLFIFLSYGSGLLSAEEAQYRLLEEDELFWGRVLADTSINNRNELHAAYIAYLERFYDLSIETFNSSIKHNLSNEAVKAIAEYYTGKTFFHLGKYEEALARFKAASIRDLGKYSYIKSAIIINLAITYKKQDETLQFKQYLNVVIEDPSDPKYRDIALQMLPREEAFTLEDYAKEERSRRGAGDREPEKKKEQFMMLGFRLGEVFIMGDWGDIYDNTEYFNPYFMHTLNDTFGLSINLEYLSTDVQSESTPYYSSLVMFAGTADMNFFLKFNEKFGLHFLLGVGLARTVLTIPGDSAGGERNDYVSASHDPYANTSLALTWDFDGIQVNAGLSSKTIYYYHWEKKKYENNDLDMIGIFIGIAVKT